MAAYLSTKMKRRGIEDINDDFSDFSLSSPARKIRRLDAELPPIIEDEEPEVPLWFHPPTAAVERIPSYTEPMGGSGDVMEELPTFSENEERAIVLFKPIIAPLMQSPSSFSVSVDSDILSGIKNNMLWWRQSKEVKSAEDEAAGQNNTNECLAVVPWIPSELPPTSGTSGIDLPQAKFTQLEDDSMGEALMDIEEDNAIAGTDQTGELGQMNQNLHQWQQQHCMIPQPPQNTSAPLVWFR